MLADTDIKKIVERVVAIEHPQQVILFGSYACGEQTEDSDLELLVVFEKVSEKGRKMAEVRNTIGRVAPGIGVDILVSSISEIGNPPIGSTLFFSIREGRTLYEAE